MNIKKYKPPYDKNIHYNHNKSWSKEDLEYLCGVYEFDKKLDISLTLGRTVASVSQKVNEFRKNGKFKKYKEKYNAL